MFTFIDSHIHLSHHAYDGNFSAAQGCGDSFSIRKDTDRNTLINLCRENNISKVIEAGIDLSSNFKLLQLRKKYPRWIYPAVGIHPSRVFNTPFGSRFLIRLLSMYPKVIAVGELGLDFHRPELNDQRQIQYEWFIWQLKLAHKRNLPLILHIRNADDEAIPILREHKSMIHGGVVHCFRGNTATARIYTEEFGLMLGIGGALLWGPDKAKDLQDAVKDTPLEYLLLETDGPFVLPQRPIGITKSQWKETKNTSLILPQITTRIAELKGITTAEVEIVTTKNAHRAFPKL